VSRFSRGLANAGKKYPGTKSLGKAGACRACEGTPSSPSSRVSVKQDGYSRSCPKPAALELGCALQPQGRMNPRLVSRCVVVLSVVTSSLAFAQLDPFEFQRQESERIRNDAIWNQQQQQRQQGFMNWAASRKAANEAMFKAAVEEGQARAAKRKAQALAKRYPVMWWSGIPKDLEQELHRTLLRGERITGITLGSSGTCVFTFGRSGFWYDNIPASLSQALFQANGRGEEIRSVALSSSNAWFFVRNMNGYLSNGLSAPTLDGLRREAEGHNRVTSFAFVGDGSVLLTGRNGYRARNVPPQLLAAIEEANRAGKSIRIVTPTPSGWLLIKDDAAVWSNIPDVLAAALRTSYASHPDIDGVAISPEGGWVLVGRVADPNNPARVRR